MIKADFGRIVGKTISGVVVKKGESPASQLFLLFDDGADVHGTLNFMARRFVPCHGRSLPTLDRIGQLVRQALVANEYHQPDLCRQALMQLLCELEPAWKEGRRG